LPDQLSPNLSLNLLFPNMESTGAATSECPHSIRDSSSSKPRKIEICLTA